VENGFIRFWPLSEWHRVSEEAAAADSQLHDAILFADHSIECWWYAFDSSRVALSSAVYMVTGANDDRLVAPSLALALA
jgi:hypothetical protein